MSDSQTHFIAKCPHCSSSLKVRRIYLGQTVACKQCGHSFIGNEAQQPSAVGSGANAARPIAQPSRDVERILVVCQNCRVSLSVKSSRIGQVIRCKQCDSEIVVIPAPAAQPAPGSAAVRSTPADDLLHLATLPENGGEAEESLRTECETLHAELEKLGVERNLLESELERLREEGREMCTAQSQRDELARTLEERIRDLEAVRAERDSIGEQLKKQAEELNATRGERARADSEQEHREQIARALEECRRELEAVHAERDSWGEQLKQREEELGATRAAHERADAERQAALRDIEQHRSRADREEASNQSEIQELRQTLDRQRKDHQDELARRTAEFDELSDQYRQLRDQLDASDRAIKEHQDRNQELIEAQTQLESDLRSQLAGERRGQLELESQLEGERRRQLELEAQFEGERRRQLQLEEQLEVLRAESTALRESASRSPTFQPNGPELGALDPARHDELGSARAEILKLKQQIGELERLQHDISNVLNTLGLRVDLG